jgi:hypothetical protein
MGGRYSENYGQNFTGTLADGAHVGDALPGNPSIRRHGNNTRRPPADRRSPRHSSRSSRHGGQRPVVQWYGSEALELTYKGSSGRLANELLYRHDEARIQVMEHGRPWSFDGDGHLVRLVSEAHRIRLAHLFDPVLAVHTSLVEPLPHQITAVYEVMLPRQPLRFLLADDPGAGKTIMAGLLIKELIVRGDLQRCLIVCPGSWVN